MEMIVNMHEAKTHLSRLANRALSGEEIIIARNGTPLLRLMPIGNTGKERKPGLSRGSATLSSDFADPLTDEMIQEFEK